MLQVEFYNCKAFLAPVDNSKESVPEGYKMYNAPTVSSGFREPQPGDALLGQACGEGHKSMLICTVLEKVISCLLTKK